MNKQLDACFDRVEKALGTLIDSIAKYNPSTNQVQELGSADAELTKGLRDLQTHQSNYQRLQDLRASTAKYDTQIKDTLRLLANTRKELVHASATVFPDGPNYEIRYDELLSYARRISKTTIPPVGAVNAISAAISESSQIKGEAASAPETAATTPAGGTPNGTTPQPQPTQPSLTVTANGGGGGGGGGGDASQQTMSTDLPEPLATFLNPHSAYTFVPWPSEEQVRHGAIASLAYMAEQGIEPEGYDPEVERARKEREEEERKQAEEEERVEREKRERWLREEQARLRAAREREREMEEAESWRRASVSVGGAQPPPPQQQQQQQQQQAGGAAASSPTQPQPKAQFQFMGDDDDDDDD
ncbi:vitamin-D-receptor interacting mediator subunit 4-domain-containing protein [Xylaria sp. FL0043]|nr:vitamin-D-receptor interacting mediator subunit 4-domain-containing protein [Xylaria sp. FL0043]